MLEGIRILDLTRYFPGPFASLRLQERGAEVIKVEDPNGDPARVMDRLDGEEGVIFRSMSRGKPCVCVNLKDPAEREKFYALVSTADALIESFRPGVTAKLGIDYPTLSKLNPRLVYVSVTGYGQTGTYRALAGHDLNYLAMSGVMDQLLDDGGKPIKPQIALADLVTGVTVSEAVAMGLVKSSRSGQGAYIDLSMTDAMLSFMGLHISNASATGEIHGINDHGIGYGMNNRFAEKRRRYLREHRDGIYTGMLLTGKLDEHLKEIGDTAQEMFNRLVAQMKDAEGVTEQLKAENQMEWVGRMNSIRSRAEEVVLSELVYC